MNFKENYVNEIKKRINDGLSPSRAFISYYLCLFFRLDYGDERDFICDKPNDKGIDAIYVNDETEEIYFIQSKFGDSTPEKYYKSDKSIGDKDPSQFLGSVEKFKTKEGIDTILNSSKTAKELKDLITDLQLKNKTHYDFRKIFITNGKHNQDSLDIKESTSIEFVLLNDFEQEYNRYMSIINSTKPSPINFEFYPVGKTIISSSYDSIICLMKVKDLVQIDGISDYTVFTENVRGWLGRNRVFKSITKNLKDPSFQQEKNILYHNGITIICSRIEKKDDKVSIFDLSIVNGCQSTYAYYMNRDYLKNSNQVLVKIIALKDHPTIDKKNIVHFSNNQIAVKASDLVSLSDNSQYIKNIFLEKDKDWCIKIKDGRDSEECKDKKIIKLSQLAQYVASFYNVGHIRAANKNKLIETSYYEVFNGIEYEHIKIVLILAELFDIAVEELKTSKTSNQERLLNSYHLTKLFFLNSLKHIYLEIHKIKTISLNKYLSNFVKDETKDILKINYKNMIIDLTSYLTTNNQIEDYKSFLKNQDKSRILMEEIKKEYQKNIAKNPDSSLEKTCILS